MASGKEIRTQIRSISNTRKITKAMEMVAASKMRKAQDRMAATRPYSEKIRKVIAHLAMAHPEYRHPYMVEREVRKVGVIVVSSDRGLCGGLNANLFRLLLRELQTWQEKKIPAEMCTIGQKGSAFFKRFAAGIRAQATHLGDAPGLEDILGTVGVMLRAYEEGEVDRVYVAYNRFVNTMTQEPVIEQLLPIHAEEPDPELKHHWDYIYEPDSREIVDALLIRYVESLAYQAVVENLASEQAARMVAMKAASDNAGNLIDELKLAYNKARQAAITQELSEIVGGAAAV